MAEAQLRTVVAVAAAAKAVDTADKVGPRHTQYITEFSRFISRRTASDSHTLAHMTTIQIMRAAIAELDLLQHPFYRAWSAGTLPQSALATYAREYGCFIAVLDRGWQALGEQESAQVERDHVALWNDFARALDTKVTQTPSCSAVRALVDEAQASFASPASAAGALYAFELQQPATAKSKLEGLDTHYASLPDGVRPYFSAHAGESGEDVMLENKIASMSAADQHEAVAACARMSKALWNALSDIHPSCMN
jgi:pyrroloquinoline-quinone synthase